ncbi:MAG: PilZ domain-containing protein, partial [Gammaproteobacteria bacterium]
VWGELAGFARARRHSTRACLTGAGIPSRRLIAANIEKFTNSELATESLESTIENVEIEHIELKVADEPAKNDRCQREHTRVEYGNIKVQFMVGTKPKRFRPFTRVFPCEAVDISMGGACIQSTKRLYKNETITLYFSPHGGEEVTIAGEVVRTTGIGKALFKYGIQFFGTIPQGELQTIICRRAVEKKVRGDPKSVN